MHAHTPSDTESREKRKSKKKIKMMSVDGKIICEIENKLHRFIVLRCYRSELCVGWTLSMWNGVTNCVCVLTNFHNGHNFSSDLSVISEVLLSSSYIQDTETKTNSDRCRPYRVRNLQLHFTHFSRKKKYSDFHLPLYPSTSNRWKFCHVFSWFEIRRNDEEEEKRRNR